MRAVGLVVIATAALVVTAQAQPAGDTAKFQPAILNLRGCIMSNAPPANIAGVRSIDDALDYFQRRCFGAFSSALMQLGAGDAAPGDIPSASKRRVDCVPATSRPALIVRRINTRITRE